MYTVLIAGGGLQGISTARSLKEAGFRVGMWSIENDYALSSSALSFKKGKTKEELYDLVTLQRFIAENNCDVVIPMSDKFAFLLSENKEYILKENRCIAAVPDIQTLSLAGDKANLMDFCTTHNIPHPLTLNPANLTQKDYQLLNYPLLIKPNQSVGARGIKKVNNEVELEQWLPIIGYKYGDCHVQEFIETGSRPYYNVMVYRNTNGEILGLVTIEILRYYPLEGGSSSLCRSINNEKISEIVTKALDKLNYVGFADFDILQNQNGEYKIIEINPRVPASLRAAAISGINFPEIIVKDALGLKLPPYNFSPDKYLRYLGLDIMWFLKSPMRFKVNPGWCKFWGSNLFYQEGGSKDFKPMMKSLISNFNKLELKNGRIRKKENL